MVIFVYHKKVSHAMRLQHWSRMSDMQKGLTLAQTNNNKLNSKTANLLQESTNFKFTILKDQVCMLATIAEHN